MRFRFPGRLLGLLAPIVAAGPAAARELTVDASGFIGVEGVAVAELFGSRVGFPDQPSRSQAASIVDGRASFQFIDLAPTDYALRVFHDENGNGGLDRGFGSEPFGFSNGADGRRPNWDAAVFTVGLDPLAIEVRVE